jgi:hypothetical protein
MRIPNESIEQFGQEQLQMLLETQSDCCVSIYLPSQAMNTETEAVPLRLWLLLDRVETQLVAQGYPLHDVRKMLKPARNLPLGVRLPFWQEQHEGLALFLAQGVFQYYHLPIAFAEQIIIGHRFAVRPLIPLLSGDGLFYLLALSENRVRFFRGTRFTMEELKLEHAPHSLAETLRYDEFEKQVHQHSASSSGLGRGQAAPVYHGQGDAGDPTNHEHLQRFLHEVDVEVCSLLSEVKAPLLLAGVNSVRGLYQKVSHYPHIAGGIAGSPDRLDAQNLHQRAWPILASHFQEPEKVALEEFCRLYSSGVRHTVHDWQHLIQAAYYQQVQTLFVPVEAQRWGTFDPDTAIATVHSQVEPGDEDLVEAAVAHTLRNGGTVYSFAEIEMPYGLPVAAILRS